MTKIKQEPDPRTGRAWIELDLEALRHNVRILQGLVPAGCRIMPAVKANAYGHGAVLLSRELNRIGIRSFCVAAANEGVELRRAGIEGEILILGYTHPLQFPLLVQYDLMPTVVDAQHAEAMARFGQPLKVHIKLDSGMHRLGERWQNLPQLLTVFSRPNLQVEGIYTHLCADDSGLPEDESYTKMQIKTFYETLAQIKAAGFTYGKQHIQSSYGIFTCPQLKCDYARVGIALCGMLSSKEDTEKHAVGLRPMLSLKSRIMLVKELLAGEVAGYGRQFVAPCDMKIAVLSIGYADGVPRALSNGVGQVLIAGKRLPIIGRICMDQLLVDLSAVPKAHQGDEAVLIGRSGEEEITACDVAEQAGTIANEIFSRLGSRPERLIVKS